MTDLILNHKQHFKDALYPIMHEDEAYGPIYGGLFGRALMNAIDMEKAEFSLSRDLIFKTQPADWKFESFPKTKANNGE